MKKQSILLLAFWCSSFLIQAQTVTTFTEGNPDDGIAIDSQGNIYASSFGGDSVFQYTPSGDIEIFISGLITPNGLAFDSNGNLYVNDWQPSLHKQYNSSGTFQDEISIPGNVSGMIKAFDNDDMIVTRFSGNTIHRIASDGTITDISTDPSLNGPVGLAYDDSGNLYVGNFNNREIYLVQPDGSLQYIATVGGGSSLGFIAYAQGMLWGTVLGEHKIYRIDPNGIDDVTLFAGSTAGGNDGALSNATFNQPNGIAFSADEQTMYVTDFGSKNLRVISGISLTTNDFEKQLQVKVVPNPASDRFEIILPQKDNTKKNVVVYDMSGKKLVAYEVNTDTLSIDSSNWNKGVYIVEIISKKGKFSAKLVK